MLNCRLMDHNRITDYQSPDDFGAADRPAGHAPMALALQQTMPLPDIYAMAWTLAVRDHEIDRLFNADFYQI